MKRAKLTKLHMKVVIYTLVLGGSVWVLNSTFRSVALSWPDQGLLVASGWIDLLSCILNCSLLGLVLHDMKNDPMKDTVVAVMLKSGLLTVTVLVLECLSFGFDGSKIIAAIGMLPYKLYLCVLPILLYQFVLIMSKEFGGLNTHRAYEDSS